MAPAQVFMLLTLLLGSLENCAGECTDGDCSIDSADKTSLLQAQYHVSEVDLNAPHWDNMSAWAGGKAKTGRGGIHRDEMLTMLYGRPLNPLDQIVRQRCAGADKFPFSITDQQLVQVVDPVLHSSSRPVVFIEVGVLYGRTSIRMAERIMAKASHKPNLKNSIVLSIDTWLGDMALWNLLNWKDTVLQHGGTPQDYDCYVGEVQASTARHYIAPLRLNSQIAARLLHQKGVLADLIYVDGSHDYEDVLTDLHRFSRLLTPCGSMFGDDFSLEQVKAAVQKYSKDHGLKIDTIPMRTWHQKEQVGWVLRNPSSDCAGI